MNEMNPQGVRKFVPGVDYPFDQDEYTALTLSFRDVMPPEVFASLKTTMNQDDLEEYLHNSVQEHENESGWAISGKVKIDWFAWVNDFHAEHPDFGTVFGNFETGVYATSKEAFEHFYANHTPTAWDYGEI